MELFGRRESIVIAATEEASAAYSRHQAGKRVEMRAVYHACNNV